MSGDDFIWVLSAVVAVELGGCKDDVVGIVRDLIPKQHNERRRKVGDLEVKDGV